MRLSGKKSICKRCIAHNETINLTIFIQLIIVFMKIKLLKFQKCAALIVAALGFHCVSAQTYTEGSSLATGDFYLYNIGAQKFLNTASSGEGVNTAALSSIGLPVTVGTTTYFFSKYYTFYTDVNSGYLDQDLNMNASSSERFSISSVSVDGYTNVYTISYSSNYLGYDGSSSAVTTSTSSSENYYWLLLTRDQLIDKLSEATSDDPLDASFLIGGQDLSYQVPISDWTGEYTAWNGNYDNYVIEEWNRTFDFYQELTDLPTGKYVLSCQGFYRAGSAADALTNIDTQNAYLYAGSKSTPLINIATEAGATGQAEEYSTTNGYIPNSISGASTALTNGLYADNSVTVYVTSGTLTIGVKKETTIYDDWTVFDSFRLTYYGESEDADYLYSLLEELIEEASAFDQTTLNDAMASTLATAISRAQSYTADYSVEELRAAYNSLSAALTEAETAADLLSLVNDLLTKCNETLEGTVADDQTTFSDVIDSAEESLAAATTSSDLQEIYDTLESAYESYAVTAYPTDGYELDLTFLIDNNSFEMGDLTSWTITESYDYGVFSTTSSYTMTNYDGDYLFNTWTGDTSFEYSLSQTLTGVPEGYYTLKAVLATDNGTLNLSAGDYSTTFTGTSSSEGVEVSLENILVEESDDSTLVISVTSTGVWFKADNFRLYMTGDNLDSLRTVLSELVDSAEAIVEAAEASEGILAALQEAIDGEASVLQTKTGLTEAIAELEDLIAAADTYGDVSVDVTALIETCRSYIEHSLAYQSDAETFSSALDAAESALASLTNSDDLEALLSTIEAARQAYTQVAYATSEDYPFDMSYLLTIDPDCETTDGWTMSTSFDTNSSQHWSGDTSNKYLEPCIWGSESWSYTATSGVSGLPTAVYTIKAAGRASAYSTLTLSLSSGDATGEYTYACLEDTGGTIATDGTECESVSAGTEAGYSFAHDGAGYGWTWGTASASVSNDTVTITISSEANTIYQWCSIDDFSLLMTDTLGLLDDLNELIAECETYLANCQDDTDDEVVSAFESTIATAKSGLSSTFTYLDDIDALYSALETARQEFVTNSYPVDGFAYDMTFLLTNPDGSSVDGWEIIGTADVLSGEHWSGDATRKYMEPCDYYSTYWLCGLRQTIELPDGKYRLTATGRAHTSATLEMRANQSSGQFESVGNTGGTIATDGTECESVDAGISAGYSFANSDEGYGWNYLVLDSILTKDTLGIVIHSESYSQYTWCSISDLKLELIAEMSEDDYWALALSQLKELVDNASSMSANQENTGDDPFYVAVDFQETYSAACSAAEQVRDSASNYTSDELYEAISTLQAAMEEYEDPMLNKPEDGDRFYLILNTEENDLVDQNALTYIYATTNECNYNLKWLCEPDSTYAQAWIFIALEEKNHYYIGFTDESGDTLYLCSRVTGGYTEENRTDQIRVTNDKSKALDVHVGITSTIDVWHLQNTEHGFYLGNGDYANVNNDLFTTVQYYDVTIVQAPGVTVELTITDASEYYATLMLPFSASKPDDLTVYYLTELGETVDSVTTLIYEEQDTLIANTPYVVYANQETETTFSFTGYGMATEAFYSTDYMTGTHVDTTAIVGTYVLQNHTDSDYGLAFYIVNDVTPTVKANRAFVNAIDLDSQANISVALLPGSETTAVGAIEADEDALTVEEETIVKVYSLSGVLIRSEVAKDKALQGLPKGIYIVNGRKYTVK